MFAAFHKNYGDCSQVRFLLENLTFLESRNQRFWRHRNLMYESLETGLLSNPVIIISISFTAQKQTLLFMPKQDKKYFESISLPQISYTFDKDVVHGGSERTAGTGAVCFFLGNVLLSTFLPATSSTFESSSGLQNNSCKKPRAAYLPAKKT